MRGGRVLILAISTLLVIPAIASAQALLVSLPDGTVTASNQDSGTGGSSWVGESVTTVTLNAEDLLPGRHVAISGKITGISNPTTSWVEIGLIPKDRYDYWQTEFGGAYKSAVFDKGLYVVHWDDTGLALGLQEGWDDWTSTTYHNKNGLTQPFAWPLASPTVGAPWDFAFTMDPDPDPNESTLSVLGGTLYGTQPFPYGIDDGKPVANDNDYTECYLIAQIWSLTASASFSFTDVQAVVTPSTIGSSTMYFQGALTDNGDGTYTGVLPMIDEGVPDAGYDVYAEEGATAWFGNDPGGGPVWTPEVIADHDAWPSWNPDTPDWYQYSLNLYVDGSDQKWAVRNHPGATETNPWADEGFWGVGGKPPAGVPMSGLMYWTTLYAAETDAGAYLPATGIPEIPGGAAGQGGGAGAWDMDWSWGSEVVPLELPGFEVAITDLGGGVYDVTLTPADPTEVWVDDDFTSATPGWGVTHFDNIQDGIDAVDGSTVNVAAGTYYEDSILIDKPVTIIGAPGTCGPDAGAPVIDGSGADANGFEIAPGVDDVIIEGFFIRNFGVTPAAAGQGCGVWAYGTSADPTTNITVRHNQFDNCIWASVFFFNEGQSVFDNIDVDCNTVNIGPWSSDTHVYGIEITNCKNSMVSHNTVTGGFTGILMTAQPHVAAVVVENNTITNNSVSGSVGFGGNIQAVAWGNFDGTIQDITISQNDIRVNHTDVGYGGYGVRAYFYAPCIFAGDFDVNGNSVTITDPSYSAIKNQTGMLWDASANYYGTTDAATVAGVVGSDVDYTPWLGGGTYNSPGFDGDFSELWVDDDSPQTGTDGRIQEGIDLVDGSTVNVAAGTYVEDVTIDKALVMIGAGPTSTHLMPTGSAAAITVTANDVSISQIEVTNTPQLVEGLRVTGATSGLTLDYVYFTNLGNNPGPGNAFGVVFSNSFDDLTISNGQFIATNLGEYSRAIGVFTPNDYLYTNFDVSGTDFEYLFVGIYLRSDINGLAATGNTFGPFELADCQAAVAGIYIGDGTDDNFNIQNVTVTGNNFTDYGRGVYVWDYAANTAINAFVISGNTFTNSIYSSAIRFILGLNGFEDYDIGGIEIDNNTFTQNSDVGANVALVDLRTYDANLLSCNVAVTDNQMTFSGGPYADAMYGIRFFAGGDAFYSATVSGNVLNGGNTAGAGDPSSLGVNVYHYGNDYTWANALDIDILNN